MTKVLTLLSLPLRNVVGAAPAHRRAVSLRARVRAAQLGLVGVSILMLTACSDAIVAPRATMDRVAAARLMPSVTDARLRIAPGIENAAIRERVEYDLGELEIALSNGDANASQFRMRLVASVLADYQTQPGSAIDRPDITGILLAMNAVTKVLGNETLTSIL